ncbi:MAG: tRNA uridine-5-carboxymethylaminomethyl(34) synthesis GTPase MnmE [Chitinophagaceae bacterium]|nr:tRNA uridine-5-carboxymethylaminomethyl(34) synthesis GTPase MnmE [Chitinophagaceae bacterium]
MLHLTASVDTIIAPATPSGEGAIGIIRLSGAQAIPLCDVFFRGRKPLHAVKSHTLHYGHLYEEERLLDEVVVSVFKGPRSYTGEDVVEISCHGSSYILSEVMQAFMRKGARMASPGEFTQRAFFNGRLDLSQAESVADIIASENAAQHQLAFSQMRGGYTNVLQNLRNELITFAGLIELELDFSQEDVAFADRTALQSLLTRIQQTLHQLIQSFQLGNVLKKGIPVAIIGEPNVGKSTLLNALLNEEKALVSDIAGTTRDVIEDVLTIEGIAFRFLDTAGLRETNDVLEARGIARSYEKMKTARVILYLVDSRTPVDEISQRFTELNVQEEQTAMLVLNKADLMPESALQAKLNELKHASTGPVYAISAKANTDIHAIRNALVNWVHHHPLQQQGMIVSNVRHVEALQRTQEAVNVIQQGIEQNLSGDLLAIDIRMALHHLGSITGQVEIDRDILGTIFGKFCIGK